MRYFAIITSDYWASKNRAYDQARAVAKTMDRTLLDSDDARSRYILEFKSKIDQVNKNNPRCMDLKLSILGEERGPIKAGQDCSLIIDSVTHISIYFVKH